MQLFGDHANIILVVDTLNVKCDPHLFLPLPQYPHSIFSINSNVFPPLENNELCQAVDFSFACPFSNELYLESLEAYSGRMREQLRHCKNWRTSNFVGICRVIYRPFWPDCGISAKTSKPRFCVDLQFLCFCASFWLFFVFLTNHKLYNLSHFLGGISLSFIFEIPFSLYH